jgi:hypothetical protein
MDRETETVETVESLFVNGKLWVIGVVPVLDVPPELAVVHCI